MRKSKWNDCVELKFQSYRHNKRNPINRQWSGEIALQLTRLGICHALERMFCSLVSTSNVVGKTILYCLPAWKYALSNHAFAIIDRRGINCFSLWCDNDTGIKVSLWNYLINIAADHYFCQIYRFPINLFLFTSFGHLQIPATLFLNKLITQENSVDYINYLLFNKMDQWNFT